MADDPAEKDETFLAADLLPAGCIEDVEKASVEEEEEEEDDDDSSNAVSDLSLIHI